MEEILNRFLLDQKELNRKSDNTLSAYRHDILRLIGFLNTKKITDFSQVGFMDLNAFILKLEKDGAATSSVSRTISVLKSFFSYLYRKRIIDTEPAFGIHAPKVEKKIPEILTVQEMEQLLAEPDVTTVKGKRDLAILELLYATGIRISELSGLTISEVDLQLSCIHYRAEERTWRMVPFGSSAGKALLDYLANSRPFFAPAESNLLFLNMNGGQLSRQGLWKVIRQYGILAGLDHRLTPHTIRHTLAAHMVANGADLTTIQEILGHSDISTTQIYAAFGKKKLHAVYDTTHPRK